MTKRIIAAKRVIHKPLPVWGACLCIGLAIPQPSILAQSGNNDDVLQRMNQGYFFPGIQGGSSSTSGSYYRDIPPDQVPWNHIEAVWQPKETQIIFRVFKGSVVIEHENEDVEDVEIPAGGEVIATDIDITEVEMMDACDDSLTGSEETQLLVKNLECLRDQDQDGIFDHLDACPNSRLGVPVDSRGCEIVGSIERVYFAQNSTELSDEARIVLDNIAILLRTLPTEKFDIAGHTDAASDSLDAENLGEDRASIVADYLISVGTPPFQLRITSYGALRPISDNSTDAGQARNRRVEISQQ